MNETETPEVAKQTTFKITAPNGEVFEFPGLAYTKDGAITIASLLDVFWVIASSLDHPTVNQILKANDVVQKDVNGKLYFPKPNTDANPSNVEEDDRQLEFNL